MSIIKIEPVHDKTNKMTGAPSDNSDQPGHRPSLIRVFNCAHSVAKDSSFFHADRGLQFDLSFRCVHMLFCWFCHALAHFIMDIKKENLIRIKTLKDTLFKTW